MINRESGKPGILSHRYINTGETSFSFNSTHHSDQILNSKTGDNKPGHNMGDPYTYIRDGEILTGEDGLLAKVRTKASQVVNKLKKSLNIDKATSFEEAPDELINNLVSAFKDGALQFKPGLETKRDNSSFKTTSNQSSDVNHSTEGSKNVTVENSTKTGSATWKDGGHATFTLGGDPIVDGGAGAHLDADYNISSTRTEKVSDPNSDGFDYRGVDVNKSATGNIKTGGHVEVCGRRLDVPIDIHGEANCGYSHSKEDGTIHYQTTDGNKMMNTRETKHERSVGARSGASGGVSVMNNSINADAGARFDAGCSVSSKHTDGESMPNIDGYEYEGTETEYAAAAHFNSESHLNASANVLRKTADVNVTGTLKAKGQASCSHQNFKERTSTQEETRERRVFHKVRAEASGEFEASVNANGKIGEKSKGCEASVKGKARGHAEATAAEWSYTKNKDGFTGRFEALSAEAEGEAELEASIGSKSVRMNAEGRVAAKAVDATADLTVKKDEEKTSIGGIHANIGHLSARGRAGINDKSVQAEAELKLASVNALQAEVREKEHCDEADIHVKAGLANANVGNAKIVGKRTGKKATITTDHTLAELNAGNVSITGIDDRKSNRAGVSARLKTTATANIGNVDITGLGSRESRFEANTAPGVDAFNFRCGIHRNTGASVSTNRASFCNVDLSIGPPNWNISLGNSFGNIGIPFFGGGGGGGGSSGGGNQNQTEGEEDEDDDGTGGNGTGGNETGGNETGGNGSGTGGNGSGTGGNGTGGNGNGRNGSGTGGNGTGTAGHGTGGNGTGGNGTGGNDSGTGGNGTGTAGHGTGGNGTGGNGTGGNDSGTGGNGNGTGGNGSGTGGNGTGGNGSGTGGNSSGTSTCWGGTGPGGSRLGHSGNGSVRGRAGNSGTSGNSGSGTGRTGNGTGNGNGTGGNGTGSSGNGTGTGRSGNGTGTSWNGTGQGGSRIGHSGNGSGRAGNSNNHNGNSSGTGGNSGTGTGRSGNGTGTGRSGNGTGTGRSGNGTGTGRNGTDTDGRRGNGTGTGTGGNGTGLNGQPGVDVRPKKPKVDLRDTADQNRMMAELVGKQFTKPSGNPRRPTTKQSSGAEPMDWSNTDKIEEAILKTYNPNYTPDDKQSTSSQTGSRNTKKSKPQQKQPPQKPSGSNKNIHTIFTIGAGDSKPIQKLGNNVYGFGNDD